LTAERNELRATDTIPLMFRNDARVILRGIRLFALLPGNWFESGKERKQRMADDLWAARQTKKHLNYKSHQ